MGSNNINNQPFNEDLLIKDNQLDEQNYLVVEYPDFYTGSGKKIKVKNLGEKFAAINSFFLDYLKEYHIPAAFVKSGGKNELKFIKYQKFPFVVKILNTVDKRTAKIFSRKEGQLLSLPIFELHLANKRDAMISESHLIAFDLCTNEDLKLINRICSKVNAVLKSFFERRSFLLAEATCSFGKSNDKIFLVDDFTPRSLKIIPSNTNGQEINPYKFGTSAEIRHYTDHLFNMMSA